MTHGSLPVLPLRQAYARRNALLFLFFMLGVIYASWAARIPAIRDAQGLDAATLSLVLLCSGIGAVASFPLAAWLVAHVGARRSAWFFGLALLLGLPALAWAPGLSWLMAAGVLYGAASSCFDVAINALGAALEKQEQRSLMSTLHAWFCVGSFSGALMGGAIAATGLTPGWHFTLIALVCVWPLRLACQILPQDRPQHDPSRRIFAVPHGHLVALGIIAFCGAVIEGSTADWSGVYLKDHLQASDGMAPLAFAGFTGMMLVARLLGDRWKERFGARAVVATGAFVAAIGILIASAAHSLPLALAGFALAGAGAATVFPFIYSAAGRHGPSALAGVATLGYSGNLLGPPLFGVVAHTWGISMGFVFIAALCVAVTLAASRARWLE
ncbi:MFS transporter [Herbaspirillum sp. RTI4]|nr:MFS transporter [Herbaspirillum sp. RTI4]